MKKRLAGICEISRRRWLRGAAAFVGAMSATGLSACGGGGGDSTLDTTALAGSTAAPTPAPIPTDPVPRWVPTAAWVWTEIPGTRFNDHMKSDGKGIAPAAGAEPAGGSNAGTYPYYFKQTSFGGPAYSRKNHELYMFGGGHAATTLNALARWNLGKDLPDMTLICAPTSASERQTYWTDSKVRASGYWPDGKPKSAHMYHALQYLDAVDELVAVGLAYGSDPVVDQAQWPVVACFKRGETAWKAAGYWPNLPSESIEAGLLSDAPTFTSWDGSEVYYYRDASGSGPWRKLSVKDHTIAAVGGTLTWWKTMQGAARHDQGKALLVGGQTGGGGNGYQFKLLDLATGRHTDMATAGYACPTDCSLKDLVWVSTYGYWVGWFTDVISDNVAIGTQRLIKFVQSGASTITASLIPTTGSPPAGNGGCKQGMYWDNYYGCLVFVGNMDENLRCMKMA